MFLDDLSHLDFDTLLVRWYSRCFSVSLLKTNIPSTGSVRAERWVAVLLRLQLERVPFPNCKGCDFKYNLHQRFKPATVGFTDYNDNSCWQINLAVVISITFCELAKQQIKKLLLRLLYSGFWTMNARQRWFCGRWNASLLKSGLCPISFRDSCKWQTYERNTGRVTDWWTFAKLILLLLFI